MSYHAFFSWLQRDRHHFYGDYGRVFYANASGKLVEVTEVRKATSTFAASNFPDAEYLGTVETFAKRI
jgi:hypothetical protein